MSAPKTDLEKQEKQHRGALGGMAFAAVFGVVILVSLVVWAFVSGQEPREPDAQIDSFTGEVEPVE